jgi:UDP-N-acetylmuramate--alanine ligase
MATSTDTVSPNTPKQTLETPHFQQATHIHFMGIKGVGMAAAALCADDLGIAVSGSDVDEPFVTDEVLHQRQIHTQVGFSGDHIPPETDLVVYTGAHQGVQNQEVVVAKERGIRVISHAQAVGELTEGKRTISVCGVGGKTSTSAMLANVMDYANLKPSFLVGVGKVLNLQVPGRFGEGEFFIAEADEYVVSPGYDATPRFMLQTPEIIVCTNIVHDHPDQYASLEDTKKAFIAFFRTLPQNGLLILNGDSAAIQEILASETFATNVITYGTKPENQWWVKESFIGQGKQLVTFASKTTEFNLTLSVPGMFNALNALAAYIVSIHAGIAPQAVIEGLQLFRGSKRRFEKIDERNGIQYYDDYAHHPTQITATLKAAREWLPLDRLVVVFQPHTYSRTKALLGDFATSFEFADEVIITDIYASAREPVDPTLSGYTLAEAIKAHHQNVQYIPFKDLAPHLKASLKPQDALFTLGAGDIYKIHAQIIG